MIYNAMCDYDIRIPEFVVELRSKECFFIFLTIIQEEQYKCTMQRPETGLAMR